MKINENLITIFVCVCVCVCVCACTPGGGVQEGGVRCRPEN